MLFLNFKAHFEPFRVFSIQDISKWDSNFDTRRLVEWQQKGYLHKIINRWYAFAPTLRQEELYIASNRIYSPSYISLQSALSFYRLIPEGVYTITAVTSLKTQNFHAGIGTFSYKHLKPALMFGYRLMKFENMSYRLAEPEKLMLDYLYLNPSLNTIEDLKGLRLNLNELESLLDKEKLRNYLELFGNKSLEKRVNILTKKLLHYA
jgi:predicted transcriptional regulator of viral defense system